MGLDFKGKGGDKLIDAFKKVKQEFPAYSLKIAGQKPPDKYLSSGINYVGKFKKSDPEDADRLAKLFSEAFCFVLPTSKDMTPLVLIEALSSGCPVIATRNFGIPEIVKDTDNRVVARSRAGGLTDSCLTR